MNKDDETESNGQDSKPIIDDLDEFCKTNFKNIMQVIRASHALPKAGDDHEFYSSFSGFQEFLAYQKKRLLTLISMLMKNNGYKVCASWLQFCSMHENCVPVLVRNNAFKGLRYFF